MSYRYIGDSCEPDRYQKHFYERAVESNPHLTSNFALLALALGWTTQIELVVRLITVSLIVFNDAILGRRLFPVLVYLR